MINMHEILPFPHATVSEVLGLLEIIADYNGKIRISELAEEVGMEIDDLNDVVDFCELLKFVKVQKGEIILTATGKKIISYENEDVLKQELKKRLKMIEPFRTALKFLQKNKKTTKKKFLEYMSKKFIVSDQRIYARLLLDWLLFSESIDYDIDKDEITLL